MRSIIFLLALTICSDTFSQENDSTVVMADSVYSNGTDNGNVDYSADPDTLQVTTRNFDPTTVNKLKNDPEFDYKAPPTVAESVWDRLRNWIGQFFDSFFDKAAKTNWGKVITYIAVLVAVVVIIMMILKVNAFKILARGEGANSLKHNILDENIHAMDFEKLIQDALAQNNQRLAVRLVFLFALKMLSDRNLINWHQGKTNHDYMKELNNDELKGGFNELNYYFEYAWYGDFKISPAMFTHVQETFNDWRRKL